MVRPLRVDRRLHLGGRDVIGKLQLDAFEAGGSGGVDAREQRALGEQMTEIGGKARHYVSPEQALRAAARTY